MEEEEEDSGQGTYFDLEIMTSKRKLRKMEVETITVWAVMGAVISSIKGRESHAVVALSPRSDWFADWLRGWMTWSRDRTNA
ncbi:hypothetical protein RRG08_028395 [Elysia crispata]|uniref:Uncharacterized protein n=1 Tax=Elysia crispata TaxID=231223 RepID=A0AAE1CRW8_9GAST|nr:hypothetical protein RRG08_028395 [Elysia crispata]